MSVLLLLLLFLLFLCSFCTFLVCIDFLLLLQLLLLAFLLLLLLLSLFGSCFSCFKSLLFSSRFTAAVVARFLSPFPSVLYSLSPLVRSLSLSLMQLLNRSLSIAFSLLFTFYSSHVSCSSPLPLLPRSCFSFPTLFGLIKYAN